MKKLKHLFLILIALLSCRAAMAQDYFLDRFYSDDGVDQIQFYYNADNLLESYHSVSTLAARLTTSSTRSITTSAAM